MIKKINLKTIYNNLNKNIFISKICSNTNHITKENCLFVALKGGKGDGHNHLLKAFEMGASAAIVKEINKDLDSKYTQIKVNNPFLEYARISYLLSNFSNKLVTIGVTGTDGKTSSCELLFKVLNRLGNNTAYIGTNGIQYNGKRKNLYCTTPNPDYLYHYLSDMERTNVNNLAIEISSHALKSNRADFIKLNYAVFLNLTRDHFDFHRNFLDYKNSKLHIMDLINKNSKVLINIDDSNHIDFINRAQTKCKNIVRFSIESEKADIYAININNSFTGSTFDLIINNKIYKDFYTPLIGKYNIYNMLIALIICLDFNYDLISFKKVLRTIKNIEGRMEYFYNKKRDFNCLVDFAHAPTAIKNILIQSRKLCTGKIIVVTGAVGHGDKGKRSLMADNCLKYADLSIFTTDQPYSENPKEIILDMLTNTKDVDRDKYKIILNRKDAIKAALDYADKKDIVVILGKGRENEIKYLNKTIEFNDYEYVKHYMNS